jgi:hypothetical protein
MQMAGQLDDGRATLWQLPLRHLPTGEISQSIDQGCARAYSRSPKKIQFMIPILLMLIYYGL